MSLADYADLGLFAVDAQWRAIPLMALRFGDDVVGKQWLAELGEGYADVSVPLGLRSSSLARHRCTDRPVAHATNSWKALPNFMNSQDTIL